MYVAFRVDASLQIGTGHLMRCLTLADALREQGAECTFVCRPHAGHLLELVAQRGHKPLALGEPQAHYNAPADPAHAAWLGTSWVDDAEQTKRALSKQSVDWLVVDHYALDARWEQALRHQAKGIMVIDDLADRAHACDLLLDQNLGRGAQDYDDLLKGKTIILVGPQYALLRPEFAALRAQSLARRQNTSQLNRLLITMGGVDKDNATTQVLTALQSCNLPVDLRVTVVMGSHAPWLEQVEAKAVEMPWQTQVLVGVSNMAKLMAESDLAIGAAGSTSWERCCLGLPTVQIVLAANQVAIAEALAHLGATKTSTPSSLPAVLTEICLMLPLGQVQDMSRSAAQITSGNGVSRVVAQLMEF